MPGDYFWKRVEALAASFDVNADQQDENLNLYLHHCVQYAPAQRDEIRRQLMQIIGGLAQLQARLSEHESGASL